MFKNKPRKDQLISRNLMNPRTQLKYSKRYMGENTSQQDKIHNARPLMKNQACSKTRKMTQNMENNQPINIDHEMTQEMN